MPNVTATPRGHNNGQVITEFVDSVGTESVTYTYPTAQEKLWVRNTGLSPITVTVGANTQTIQRGERKEIEAEFTSFSIASSSGVQSFEATADKKGSVFDTPEGRYFSTLSVGGGAMLKSVYDTNDNGVVDQAAKLQTARTITLSGDVTGSASFDGSANITIATTGGGVNGAPIDDTAPSTTKTYSSQKSTDLLATKAPTNDSRFHTHANQTVLDLLGDNGTALTYKGDTISGGAGPAADALQGKKLGIFGSSTSDEAFIGAGVYHRVIANRTGLITSSQALAGTKLTPGTVDYTVDPNRNVLKQIDALPAALDFVVGMPGANDEISASTLGTFDSAATWDFYSTLHKMCQKMLNKWPNIPLGIMASQYMGSPTAGTVVTQRTSAYHDAIAEVCGYYGIPFIDLAKEGRTPYSYLPFKNSHVQADGLHLNASGNLILSYRVEAFYRMLLSSESIPEIAPIPPPSGNTISDDFNRANSATTLGAPWSIYGTAVYGIDNNQAHMVSGSGGSFQYAAVTYESSDATVELEFPSIPADQHPRIYFRGTNANNMWGFVPFDTGDGGLRWTLYKYEAGAATNMQTVVGYEREANGWVTRAPGDRVRVVCAGNNIKCYANDILVYDIDHAFNNTGKLFGFGGQNSTTFRVDNFVVRQSAS